MAKRSRTAQKASGEIGKPTKRQPRPDIVHTSVYLHQSVYDALRKIAFDERAKIHDLIMQGVELAIRKRGYPPIEEMRAAYERKRGRKADS